MEDFTRLAEIGEELSDPLKEVLSILDADDRCVFVEAYQELYKDRDLIKSHLKAVQRTRKTERENQCQDSYGTNAIERWNKQSHKRTSIAASLSHKLHIPQEELAMNRGNEWRQRVEAIEQIIASRPLCDRQLGVDQWQMSLRDAWERWIPLGNVFSGLYTAVYDDTRRLVERDLTSIHTHLHPVKKNSNFKKGPSLSGRNRAWINSEWLKEKAETLESYFKNVRPHRPKCSELSVVGASVEHELWKTVSRDITLQDVLRVLKDKNPPLYQKLTQTQPETPIVDNIVLSESKPTAVGPHLRLAQKDELVFLSCGTDVSSKWIQVENVGTCALHYQWSNHNVRHPVCSESSEQITDHESDSQQDARKHHFNGLCVNVRSHSISKSFYVDSQRGVILPEETKHFRFSFSATYPGCYMANWQLCTKPKVQTPAEVSVPLRGVSFGSKNLHKQHLSVQHDLAKSTTICTVNVVMKKILDLAMQKAKASFNRRSEEGSETSPFTRLNAGHNPSLFYRTSVLTKMNALYRTLHNIWNSILSERTEQKKGTKSKKQAVDKEPLDQFPDEWDLRVDSIHSLIAAVRKTHFAASVKAQIHLSDLVRKASILPNRISAYRLAVSRCLMNFTSNINIQPYAKVETLGHPSSGNVEQTGTNEEQRQNQTPSAQIRQMLLESLLMFEDELKSLLPPESDHSIKKSGDVADSVLYEFQPNNLS